MDSKKELLAFALVRTASGFGTLKGRGWIQI